MVAISYLSNYKGICNNIYGCRSGPAAGMGGTDQCLPGLPGGNANEGLRRPKRQYKIQLLLPDLPNASGMSGYSSGTDNPSSHGTSSFGITEPDQQTI